MFCDLYVNDFLLCIDINFMSILYFIGILVSWRNFLLVFFVSEKEGIFFML